jgi:hypothetical protein
LTDPVVLLKKDHREVAAMLKTLAGSKPGARRRSTVKKLDGALRLHMQIEEDDVYLEHHVKEEEQEMFPDLKDKLERDQLLALGGEVQAAREQARAKVRAKS